MSRPDQPPLTGPSPPGGGWSASGVAGALTVAATIATFCAPELLWLEREAVLSGQLWRLWTGHLVHWTPAHLLWDGLTFLVLARWVGIWAPRRLAAILLAGAPGLSLAILTMEPHLDPYAGLSGLDVALWMAACLLVAGRATTPWLRRIAFALLVGGLAKVGAEVVSGQATLVDGAFTLSRWAHLAGAALGLVAGLGHRRPVYGHP